MDLEQMRKLLALKYLGPFTPVELLKLCEACWKYDYETMRGPHAILASGKHSDGYYNVTELMKFPNFRNFISLLLVDKFRKVCSGGRIDVVVSSSYADISIGQSVVDRTKATVSVYTEKVGQEQKWTGRFSLPKGSKVLLVEDLITTMRTVEEVKNALEETLGSSNFEFITYKGKIVVLTVVHRPAELPANYNNFFVISVLEEKVHDWTPDECPLCKQEGEGKSEPKKPKENWAEFNEFSA